MHPSRASGMVRSRQLEFHELRRRAAELVAAEAGSDEVPQRGRCRQLVDVESRFLERTDELRSDVLAEQVEADDPSSPADCSITPAQLTAYLRGRLPDSPDLTVTAMHLVPGGRSKETILVTVEGTTELPPDVIVRKDRPVGILQTRAADEFAILRLVHASGVPVPEPFFADEITDETFGTADRAGIAAAGAKGDVRGSESGSETVLVMARVPGVKAGEYFPELAAPTAHRREIGQQLATVLARLHTVPLDELAATNLDPAATVTEDSLARRGGGHGRPHQLVERAAHRGCPLARQWLLDHIVDVVPSGRLCLLQGDVGLHNLLVEDGRVTALVDWEAATIGPPARELAAAWPAATALMAWGEFIDAYRAAGGTPQATDPDAVVFYRVFFALGACMSSRTGGDLFRTGAKRDLLTAHSGLDAHFRAQRNLGANDACARVKRLGAGTAKTWGRPTGPIGPCAGQIQAVRPGRRVIAETLRYVAIGMTSIPCSHRGVTRG